MNTAMSEQASATQAQGLREGRTTGSCAAAAAKAATLFLQTGQAPEQVDVPLPAGRERLRVPVLCVEEEGLGARACVLKDAGDDPDVTHGARIEAHVTLDLGLSAVGPHVLVDGGRGVGRVTLPGLPVAVGQAAINPGPLTQIRAAVVEALPEGCKGIAFVLIEVPEGESLAQRTMNPRLGIVGGISILGASGIVRPYSHEAWAASVRQSLAMAWAQGHEAVVFTTGRRSERYFQQDHPEVAQACLIQAADFFAQANQDALASGFKTLVWSVFFGKLVKQAQGFASTHAHEAALDFGQLARAAAAAGAELDAVRAVASANTARQVLDILGPGAVRKRLVADQAERARQAACRHSGQAVDIRYAVYDFDGSRLYADALPKTFSTAADPLPPGAVTG